MERSEEATAEWIKKKKNCGGKAANNGRFISEFKVL